jgi:hypothetical protein
VQVHDPCVKALLAQWKKRGRPIEYADLGEVAAIMGLNKPDAKMRRKIVAAVDAAGIKVHNYDAWRQQLAESGMHVQLTADGHLRMAEEARWRWPEEWDAMPPPPPQPEWVKEWELDWEYGPTLERHRWQEKRRNGGPLWFLDKD